MDIFGRAGDEVDFGKSQQLEQLVGVSVVVGVHGAGVAGGRFFGDAGAQRFCC